jgi:hypothetical protein
MKILPNILPLRDNLILLLPREAVIHEIDAKPSVNQPPTEIQRKAHSQGLVLYPLRHLKDAEGDYSPKFHQE